MASNSPDSPSKKRKQPINGLRRDQPLFAGRRPPHRTLQQPPEFFTDSLNTSYIPSPSPPKSPTRHAARAKPRQTLGDGRSLAAAFRPTPRVYNENRPPSSSSSSDQKRSQETLKPRPAQIHPGAKRLTPSKPARSPARNRTPTPPRGRQASITSLTSPADSESSPGRGYAEAYQRIVEEENLAQEESLEDLEEIEGYDFSNRDRSQEFDRSQLRRLQNSTSPMSQKASRRASPRGAMDEDAPVQEEKDNMAHESGSESGVENTENITDTSMDSASSQYAKDLHRLGALKSGAKAFSKARVGEKGGLTVENLQRRNGSNESLGSSFSAGSLSNRGSDPSINVPKAWGRKAKPGKDWLARINSRSGRFTGDVPKRHSSGEHMISGNHQREWSEPIDQWIATAADVPLPSSEDRLSGMDDSQGSTPTTAVPRSGSPGRRRQWEVMDDDFTGRSLQISESPPIRIRNTALDRIRDREIKNLEKRAVTTSRLGELREKSSGESLRRAQSTKSAENLQQVDQNSGQKPASSRQPYVSSKHEAEPQRTYEEETPDDSLHDEGEPIPDTPVVIYRNNSHEPVGSDKRSGKKPEDARETDRRPSHQRKDSHDLLKRLSRVTSESPSPIREHAEIVQEVEQTPALVKSATNVKTPVVTGAWVDQTLEDTLGSSVLKSSLKTPLITGAWIDTPLPTGGRGPPMPTPSDQEEQKELNAGKVGAADLIHRLSPNTITSRPKVQDQAPLKYSGPPLAKSALDEILNNARSKNRGKPIEPSRDSDDPEENPTLHLGESTIQSLEELVANNTEEDFSTLLAPTPPSPETSNPSSSDPSPSSQALTTTSTTTTTSRSSRLTDLQSYTHLLSRLTNLAPSLRASKKRIETLERAVSTVPANQTSATQIQNRDPDQECIEAGSLHDFLFPCQRCGCPGRPPSSPSPSLLPTLTSATTTLTLPIPALWYYPTPRSRLPRLTWLGLITVLAYTAYLIESYARFKYCHPLYATSMVGYGSGIDKPVPPFVALKVLYRHTAFGTVLTPLWYALRVILRLVGWVVGYVVGFVMGDGDGAGSVAGNVAQRQSQPKFSKGAFSWGDGGLSMMGDEYL